MFFFVLFIESGFFRCCQTRKFHSQFDMSAFTKMQMKATRVTNDYMRKVVDKINGGIQFAAGPVQENFRKATFDAPWVILLIGTTIFMSCPLIAYPWFKEWFLNDVRAQRESERVKLCLEKGIDPYPTLQHKDYVHGNVMPALQYDQDHSPKVASWEHAAMVRYNEAKAKLVKETSADPELGVVALKKLREELREERLKMRMSFDPEPEGMRFTRGSGVNVMNS